MEASTEGAVMFAALKRRIRNPVGRILIIGIALYLLIGLVHTAGSLYCYNVRNWDVYGGFSLPPLFFPIGFLFGPLLWPVYLWANLVNGLGVFGACERFQVSSSQWLLFCSALTGQAP